MNNGIKKAMIGGVCTIITAAITIPATYHFSTNNTNSMIVNVDGSEYKVTTDKYIELAKENGKLTSENQSLKSESDVLKNEINDLNSKNEEYIKEINDLKKQINQGETDEEGGRQQGEEGKYVSLLSVAKIVDPCNGFEEMSNKTMSLRGDDYTNGFILHYYNNTEGVEFNLGNKFSKMKFKIGHLDETDKKGTFTLTYSLDGEIQSNISMQAEDPVQEIEIDLKKAKMLKLNWSNDKGYAEYGMADVMIIE